jgi:hypothetical protein
MENVEETKTPDVPETIEDPSSSSGGCPICGGSSDYSDGLCWKCDVSYYS